MKFVSDRLYRFVTQIPELPFIIRRYQQAHNILHTPYQSWTHNLAVGTNNSDLLLMTVAFNSLETIEYQAQALKKNIKDKYTYLVVDNSTKEEIASQIYEYCRKTKIGYLRIIGNPYNGVDGSKSHGLTLNWAYQNYVKNLGYLYFGIIDHDIFPTQPQSLSKILNRQPFYGMPQSRGKIWYLWPGYCFFDLKYLNLYEPNFSPIPGTDTGGGNWEVIYHRYQESDFSMPRHRYVQLKDGSQVEMIDDWIHIGAVSGWRDCHVKDVRKIMRFISGK